MHGFYRLNILRAFTICTLLLVSATACLVVVTNFGDDEVFLSLYLWLICRETNFSFLL